MGFIIRGFFVYGLKSKGSGFDFWIELVDGFWVQTILRIAAGRDKFGGENATLIAMWESGREA